MRYDFGNEKCGLADIIWRLWSSNTHFDISLVHSTMYILREWWTHVQYIHGQGERTDWEIYIIYYYAAFCNTLNNCTNIVTIITTNGDHCYKGSHISTAVVHRFVNIINNSKDKKQNKYILHMWKWNYMCGLCVWYTCE